MGREHRILSRPRPRLREVARARSRTARTASVPGGAVLSHGRVRGVILRGARPWRRWARTSAGPSPKRSWTRWRSCTRIDLPPAGLAELGHARQGIRRAAGEGLDGSRYQAARTGDVPAMEQCGALACGAPAAGRRPALIHNDFKHDNVVLDPARPRPRGGGPRLGDGDGRATPDGSGDHARPIGWTRTIRPRCAPRASSTSPPARQACAAGGRRALCPRATGRDLSRLPFYYAFGLFKVAVIAQQIYARFGPGPRPGPALRAPGRGRMAACASAAAARGRRPGASTSWEPEGGPGQGTSRGRRVQVSPRLGHGALRPGRGPSARRMPTARRVFTTDDGDDLQAVHLSSVAAAAPGSISAMTAPAASRIWDAADASRDPTRRRARTRLPLPSLPRAASL